MISGGILSDIQKSKSSSSPVETVHSKVTIYLVNDSFLVWDPDTVEFLRKEYGIVGVCIGTLPRKPRQNKTLSLPLQIMKEEAVILKIGGVVDIVRQQGLPSVRSEDNYVSYLVSSYRDQNEFLQGSIFRKSKRFVDKPVEEPAHLNLTGDIDITNPPYHLQRIFNRQSSEFWSQTFSNVSEFDLSDSEKMRLVALQDLRRRNYLVTSGTKFGGDFLVYPGDPLVYHAYFVVKVVAKSSRMKANELLAFSRLASSVKKVAVICSVEGADVSYLSLQWSGLNPSSNLLSLKPLGMLTVEDEANKENELKVPCKIVNDLDNGTKPVSTNDKDSSDEEIVHRKKKTVFEDSSDEENDLKVDENHPKINDLQSELDPEKFLEQNVESDMDSDTLHNSRKLSKLDSDSVASDHFNPSSDDSNKVRKKKKKRKKKSKKSADSDKGIGETNLTDDEEDDLLKDLSTLLNEPSVGPDVEAAGGRHSDSDSGSSVGMPEDTYIVRKTEGEDGTKPKKDKVYKDFDPEDWQNEEVKEKEHHSGKKKKKKNEGAKQEKKGGLDEVAQLVSERQRMMRETEISLPRHEPAPLQLSDCLARIPKLTALKPSKVEEKKPTFVPKLSSKTDEFFLPKDLGNFMGRFKKHLSLSAKVTSDPVPQKCSQTASKHTVPHSVFVKRNIQQSLKEKILAKKIEARKAAEQERLIDEEFRTEDPAYAELQKMLDDEEEEEMSESDPEEIDEEEAAEEVENVDERTDRRAEKILLGEEVSSSSEEEEQSKMETEGKERNYHTDTDSDLLASADEVHVNELPPSSASEDDALQPSRYSLRRLTRYCRKKRMAREKRHEERVAIGSESEKEEKARKKLQGLLKKRAEIKKKIYQKKAQKKESCTSIQDLFGGNGGLSLTGISRPSDNSHSLPAESRDSLPITSTIIPDSMDTLPVSERTFDVDTAVRTVVEDSQYSQKRQANFLTPDEDAVFLDTQGMLRSGLDISREGGIEALEGDGQVLDNSLDMLNLCSGRFGSSAAESGGFGSTAPDSGSSGGRVTVQDISFNLDPSSDVLGSGLSQTPNHPKTPSSQLRTPLSMTDQTPIRKGLSQTPLARFGNLSGVLSQESDEEESNERNHDKGKKRRALYSDLLDDEAEKSGSDHSEDENEDGFDEYDKSLLAKDSELPSDEEELAVQLKQAYHDQQALDEKEQIKRLKERFIQEEQGFFRTRKFHGEDSNLDLFSTNLGLDFEDEDVETSAEAYKEAMSKRAERLKKEQFVKEKRLKEARSMDKVDEDSQAFLDSLQDITDSNSRSAFSSSQQCGSFLKHGTGTLSRLSSVTSSSLNSEKTSNRAYVFQTVSPAQTKRKSSAKFASEPKRPKKFASSGVPASPSTESNKRKSIFNVIK
ncbi:hypothetical protein ACHWQZ_G000297 [Mnemiopsis leidyi]